MDLSRTRARLLERLQRRKTRTRERAYVAEGVRCVTEVVRGGADIKFAVISPRLSDVPGGDDLLRQLLEANTETPLVDDRTLTAIAGTETPQGVLAVCAEPTVQLDKPQCVLVADAIQDPGNFGTLIRSATAFGLDAVVALDGTVDPYNAKVVRASAGTIARIPVLATSWAELEPKLASWGSQLLVAAGEAVDAPSAMAGAWALVVGNEARGARDAIRSAATRLVAIPMPGRIDSLNAGIAGSILMYALTQSTPEGKS
jgi:TrmH family RNA methyltransferase